MDRPMKLILWLSTCGVVLAFVALALRWLRDRPYRTVFRIPASRDDSFVCRGNHEAFSVSAGLDGFELPAGVVGRGQTAFLTLKTAATIAGRFVDPFIEVWNGQRRYRQYFERAVDGQRHLNLSPLFQDGSGRVLARIDLRGSSIRWKREAKLTLFDPPPVGRAEILVLAPHPDDAEIAAFGMYSSHRSWVATITAGEGGMADLSALVSPRTLATRWNALVRVWDSLSIPQLGDVPQERCLNLVYPDGQLQRMYEQTTRSVRLACEEFLSRPTLRLRNRMPEFQGGASECTWKGLVAELRRLLEMAKPEVVLCPHPLIDGHHDHVFTTVALEEAVRDVRHKTRLFLLYVVHRRDVPLYPFGCAASLVSFPPWNDDQWVADSVYSHPLSPDTQRTKYFAVEATHDLQPYSTGERRTLRQVITAVKREVAAWVGGTGLPAATFLRRAPRPNEIYCVVSAESLSELVKRALTRYPAARD
jgi:LmbE family N-acetylglucosaminyl deacetylase